MYTNAQSLMAHKDEIQHQVMKKLNPAFIALSESRLTPEIGDCEINVTGYSVVRCNAESRFTGGVALYVRDDINYEIVLLKKLEANFWCIAIKVKEKMFKGILMVIYHSPSASHGEFIGLLEEIVEELMIREECIVLGDFNIDCMTDSFYTNKLLTTMQSLGLRQYVDKPTRVTENSKTIIDLVFANKELNVHVSHEPKITDHAWIKVVLDTREMKNKYKEFSGRDYSGFNTEDFVKMVESNLEIRQDLDIDVRATKLINNIINALDISAPKKIFRIPKIWEGKKWYSNEIEESAIKRDEAYRKALYDNTEQNWQQFKMERNAVVKLIRTKKKEFYEDMLDRNKNDPTTMWKTLKEVIRGGTTGSKLVEDIDFEILGNIRECSIADKFNLYYIQSVKDIINSIKEGSVTNTGKRIIYCIKNKGELEKFDAVTLEQLEIIVRALPNKKGTEEGITSDILKTVFCVIKNEFSDIINKSLSEGYFPKEWKTSTIIPIPKTEKPKRASDYRPINMLPIYEKVLELVVKKQIETYLESNNIITEHQSGFRKNYSCETAIQTVIDEWKLIVSERKIVGVIFLDLKRAFETIDRERLLEKLHQYGITGKALEWFKSYLEDRTQQVRINDIWSMLLTTEYGVPQGSVLGPLLFIIYINDIVKICSKDCSIKIFADDTLIYVIGESSAEIERKLNVAFNVVEEWMNNNKLKMNAGKTKFMVVRSIRKELRGKIVVKCLDGSEIEQVELMKYLGVIIDDKLRFSDHCDYMLKKIGKKISFLNRIGNYISAYTRCTIYKTIIAPHFEYCATLLIDMGETQLSRLQKAQNRAMRVILHCDRCAKIEDMLKALQFMTIRQRLYYNMCTFIFKILNNMMPEQLCNRLRIVGDGSERQTRQTGDIAIEFRRTRSAQKSLFYEGVLMYNALPTEIKHCDRLKTFKRVVKEFVISEVM